MSFCVCAEEVLMVQDLVCPVLCLKNIILLNYYTIVNHLHYFKMYTVSKKNLE